MTRVVRPPAPTGGRKMLLTGGHAGPPPRRPPPDRAVRAPVRTPGARAGGRAAWEGRRRVWRGVDVGQREGADGWGRWGRGRVAMGITPIRWASGATSLRVPPSSSEARAPVEM